MPISLESPLIESLKQELIDRPTYSFDEDIYLGELKKKLELARDMRDATHDEHDGMDYVSNYEANERAANTFIPPKKNKEDSNFTSGTVRQKLFTLLSALINLNLSGDISAFDDEAMQVQSLGDAMEDVILKTEELDNDDEKKYLRYFELLKQGTVFVEELWDEKKMKEKTLNKKFDGKLNSAIWNTRIKKAFARPTRNILPGINVYLGNITQYDINQQPYIFTLDIKPYEEAKMMFGEWDRWQNVPRQLTKINPAERESAYNNNWRLTQLQDGYVEIIRYQDKWNNEFAVVLNGVLMTPIGLPLPWGYQEYNVAQQNLEPIHAKFAYGKSLVNRIKNKVALLDELLRLAVLKTQKSFMPPYINVSGRMLSNRVLMPGKISHGIAPGTLLPINDKEAQGLTNAELAMIKEVQESINNDTTSPTFAGQNAGGNPTATEIVELQRQAKMVLGLTIFSVSMLEWKLSWLRLQNILKNWFQEEDKVVDEARGVLRSKYRKVSVDRPIYGKGMGRRMVIPTKELPSPEAVKGVEQALSQEQGMPIEIIFLNPEEVCSAKYIWQIVVRPKERKTSEVSKLLFRAYMQDLTTFFGPSVNQENAQEEFSLAWGKDPKKTFNQQPVVPQQGSESASPTISPRVKLPTAESALGQNVNNSLQSATA